MYAICNNIIERHRLLIMVGLISVFAQNDSKIHRGLLSRGLNAINISSSHCASHHLSKNL